MSTGSSNTLGKYEIIREIGRSNDVVYEAIDPTINRRVALKELAVPANVTGAQRRERIERFWREGKAAGGLAHPNIVTIYEVGQEGERYFIAMEFLEGQTLRDVLQAGGPLSLRDVENYGIQLCSALGYAHEHGVVHRDVKPDNIQVLPGKLVKLTDFGIARLMGEAPITQDGQVFGTPSYMSPEQVAGKPLDARSDIFSLGVVLYEMVAGSKPFSGDSIVTVTYNIMNMEPTPPAGAPQWLVGIIRKAMAKDPDARYASAEEMAEDLREEKCGPQFMTAPDNAYGAYPSPFGGQPQGQQQSYGAYSPPPGSPYGTPVPQGPMTPYGTPMPSPGAGGPSGTVPDPFAQHSQPYAPMPPPMPPQPIINSETRNFLGVFFLVVACAGMLVFAVWAMNLAYQSYKTSVSSEHARRYTDQGDKLYKQGNEDAAIEQWRSALRVAPGSKVAKAAEDKIYSVLVNRAYATSSKAGAAYALMNQAQELIKMRPEAPEGHYYAAYSYDLQGDIVKAKEEYQKTIQYGGNDQYAIRARERLNAIDPTGASTSVLPPAPATPPSQSSTPAPSQGDNTGIPFEPTTGH